MAILVILLILGGLLLAWLSWISIQSLLQARMLFRLGHLQAALPDRPAPAAVRGPVRILLPIESPEAGPCLWYRRKLQVLDGYGKNKGWKTRDDTTFAAHFAVEAQGREFRVEEPPTELQATETSTEYPDGGYWFASRGDRRVVHEWLRVPRLVTVVGRLEATSTSVSIVKDGRLGLFVSPHDPRKAAGIELWKGLGGLLAVTAAIALGLSLYWQNVRHF